MREQAGDAVVAAVTAANRDFHAAQVDREIVVDRDERLDRNLVEVEQRPEGAPAVVHEGLWLDEQSRDPGPDIPTGDLGLEAGFLFPLEALGGGQRINHGETEVVPAAGVVAPGGVQSSDPP